MPLVNFGFTRTQDLVYNALLRRESATGYVVARDTGLARANVYQALDVLVARGLAATSGGRPATYRALRALDVVRTLRERVEGNLCSLAEELGLSRHDAATPPAAADAGCIEETKDLLVAATAAVDAAEREVLAVTGPWARAVSDALERAHARRISCRVVSLGAPAPEGAVRREVSAAELTPYWGGLPVLLVCDRSHAVCGVVSGDRAHGVDTRSPGLVPFLRHLLRRELASAAAPHLS